VLDQAAADAAHIREMEKLAISIQGRDAFLHRILPFALVAGLVAASVLISIFASVYLGAAVFGFTSIAGVVTVYLKGVFPASPIQNSAGERPQSKTKGRRKPRLAKDQADQQAISDETSPSQP
jgi:hypothetical protein